MHDENSSRTSREPSASARPKYPSLRHKTAFVGAEVDDAMSSLRLQVVNKSPREEQPQYFTNIDTAHNDQLDSPISTPGHVAHARLSSPSPFYTADGMPSPIGSLEPESDFDAVVEGRENEQPAAPTMPLTDEEDEFELDSFNLKAPPPGRHQNSLEALTDRLFSADHLDTILHDQSLAIRFTGFLNSYRPQYVAPLKQYTEAKKVMKAVEYANATANQMAIQYGHPLHPAASLDDHFEALINHLRRCLVDEALPAYMTHCLVSIVTDTLVKEITGNNAPIMHDLIPSLAEVYCISDPSLPDNPIIYASEEFYNTTLYGREHVIGRNCRFLQGPKTSASSMRRLVEALAQGEECCETILNYRRDGSPFLNLLLICPLFDNKGRIRYFLGAQIDVSSLIEDGKGLESFARLLARDRSETQFANGPICSDPKQALHDLGQLFSPEEADAMNNQTRRTSTAPLQSLASGVTSRPGSRSGRIMLGMDLPAPKPQMWPHASLGSSGRLPGVYQNYLLVRPYPSLRITFTSPTLRIPGLLQAKFLDRIGGPESVRAGLLDALMNGTGVTAKIAWLTAGSDSLDHGKVRWIHCTPLLGSDEKVGVWMVVMVENEHITGGLNRHSQVVTPGVDSVQGAQRYTGAKLYADYLKREGRPMTGETIASSSSTRERRTADEVFQDF